MAQLPALDSCDAKPAILVASDAQAQSDIDISVVLKGAIGGCIVPAGPRNGFVPAASWDRIDDSAGVQYIVGGLAAVSPSKARAVANATYNPVTRIGGADRFATAELVGAEVRRLYQGGGTIAPTDPTAPGNTSGDLGALSSNRSYEAPVGQSEVSATLAAGRWRVTVTSDVPAGKRNDTTFWPQLEAGTCFTTATHDDSKSDSHRHVWDLRGVGAGCTEAESRTVTISVPAGQLYDHSQTDENPDWGWNARFEKRPAVNVPRAAQVSTSRETLTPVVTVPNGGTAQAKASRQLIRLGQGGWLVHVIDQASGGLNPATPAELSGGDPAADEGSTYGVRIADVSAVFTVEGGYDDAGRFVTDDTRYTCVAKATRVEVGRHPSTTGNTPTLDDTLRARYNGRDKENSPDATSALLRSRITSGTNGKAHAVGYVEAADNAIRFDASDTATYGQTNGIADTLAVWVPSGCSGYIAVEVAKPNGALFSGDGADANVKRWRVQVIPLKPKPKATS